MSKQTIEILDTPEQLAEAVADRFVSAAREAIDGRGVFFVALAGGTTPRAAYERLARPPRSSTVDWPHVQIFFGDERCVPPDSGESNFHMANDALLRAVGMPERNVHRMHGEDDPEQAARRYAEALVEQMGKHPRFDLILLGIGADGHTASLFPGNDPYTDDDRLVRAVYVDKLKTHRLTLTPVVINNAREIVVAASGLPKAPAVYAVLRGPRDPVAHPIQAIDPVDGRIIWLLDREAAAELR